MESWVPIALTDIADPELRQAVADLLRLVDSDFLWPDFTFEDHPILIVDTRSSEPAAAYCLGPCTPVARAGAGTSRVWRYAAAMPVAGGSAQFVSLAKWRLEGEGDVVTVGFEGRARSVAIAVHEDFHLHFQARYALAFGDDVGAHGMAPTHATRENLERSYSHSSPTTEELRSECTALVAALHAGPADRRTAFTALRRFSAVRAARRARAGAPAFEEDFWERQEGVPANLERRAAKHFEFADPSVINTAMTGSGCDAIPDASYFLILGGLESAVMDAFDDPRIWPHRVYPTDGTAAAALDELVDALSNTRSPER